MEIPPSPYLWPCFPISFGHLADGMYLCKMMKDPTMQNTSFAFHLRSFKEIKFNLEFGTMRFNLTKFNHECDTMQLNSWYILDGGIYHHTFKASL